MHVASLAVAALIGTSFAAPLPGAGVEGIAKRDDSGGSSALLDLIPFLTGNKNSGSSSSSTSNDQTPQDSGTSTGVTISQHSAPMQLAYSGGQTSQLTDNQQTTQSSQAAQYLQAAADAQKANKKKDDGSSDDLGAVLGATVKGVSNLVLKDATTRNGYPYGYSSYDTTSARSAVNNNNVGMSTSSGNAGGSGLMPTNCLTAGLGCPMADAHAPPGSATGGATANNGVSAAGTGGGVNRYPTNYRAASQGITGGYSTGTRRTSSSYYPSTLSSSDGTLSDYYNTYGSSSGSSSLTSARLRALYASQAGGLGTSSDS